VLSQSSSSFFFFFFLISFRHHSADANFNRSNQPTNFLFFQGFLAFYFFSTVVVGAIVRRLVTITFTHNEHLVEDEIVRATTWVHKTALLTDRPDEVTLRNMSWV